MSEPVFFAHEGELWDWYATQAAGHRELWVGLYKKETGMPSVRIREVMDAALCWGWSESKWVKLDAQRFCIRFTPRIPGKAWSAVQATRYLFLEAEGVVQEPGRAAWERRDIAKTEVELQKRRDKAKP